MMRCAGRAHQPARDRPWPDAKAEVRAERRRATGAAPRARLGRATGLVRRQVGRGRTVYDGLQLQNGHQIKGPAIVQQPTTTIIVPTDFDLKVDELQQLPDVP